MLKYFYLSLFSVFFGVVGLKAQAEITQSSIDSVNLKFQNPADEDASENKPVVITNFKYKFVPKDTLYYSAISKDSIVINYGTPLLKNRTELWRLICDSINENGNYCMQISLVSCKASEYNVGGQPVEHNNDSPWLGRKIFIEIDSVAYRYNVSYDDTTKSGMAPGSAFQPTILFPFKVSESIVGSTWMVQDLDYLAENGIPCPVLRSNYLYENKGTIDTLNENCNRLEFVRTSQGSILLEPESGQKEGLMVTSIIASGGIVDISNTRHIPIHQMQTMDQKLSIHKSKDDIIPGKHFVTTFITLVSYNKYIDSKNKKQKKSKKK